MKNRIMIGKVILEKDAIMMNTSFQYAASFEELKVPAGEYLIYTYFDDLTIRHEKIYVDCAYTEYKGTVTRGNVGNSIGSEGEYHPYHYSYSLADCFLHEHNMIEKDFWNKRYILDDAWKLVIDEVESPIDEQRGFLLGIISNPGHEYKYI